MGGISKLKKHCGIEGKYTRISVNRIQNTRVFYPIMAKAKQSGLGYVCLYIRYRTDFNEGGVINKIRNNGPDDIDKVLRNHPIVF